MVKRRSKTPRPDKNLLYDLYITKNIHVLGICKMLNKKESFIRCALQEYGIKKTDYIGNNAYNGSKYL